MRQGHAGSSAASQGCGGRPYSFGVVRVVPRGGEPSDSLVATAVWRTGQLLGGSFRVREERAASRRVEMLVRALSLWLPVTRVVWQELHVRGSTRLLDRLDGFVYQCLESSCPVSKHSVRPRSRFFERASITELYKEHVHVTRGRRFPELRVLQLTAKAVASLYSMIMRHFELLMDRVLPMHRDWPFSPPNSSLFKYNGIACRNSTM